MTWTMLFPLVVAVFEFCAGCVYAYQQNWWMALAWWCYAFACVGLAKAGG